MECQGCKLLIAMIVSLNSFLAMYASDTADCMVMIQGGAGGRRYCLTIYHSEGKIVKQIFSSKFIKGDNL